MCDVAHTTVLHTQWNRTMWTVSLPFTQSKFWIAVAHNNIAPCERAFRKCKMRYQWAEENYISMLQISLMYFLSNDTAKRSWQHWHSCSLACLWKTRLRNRNWNRSITISKVNNWIGSTVREFDLICLDTSLITFSTSSSGLAPRIKIELADRGRFVN